MTRPTIIIKIIKIIMIIIIIIIIIIKMLIEKKREASKPVQKDLKLRGEQILL